MISGIITPYTNFNARLELPMLFVCKERKAANWWLHAYIT